jgi:hypothetical protein
VLSVSFCLFGAILESADEWWRWRATQRFEHSGHNELARRGDFA